MKKEGFGLLTIYASPFHLFTFTKTSTMFSVGQLIFALFFVLVFTAVIILSYRKDKAEQPKYFKGSSIVLVAIAVVLILLFSIKLLYSQVGWYSNNFYGFCGWRTRRLPSIFYRKNSSFKWRKLSLVHVYRQYARLFFDRITERMVN